MGRKSTLKRSSQPDTCSLGKRHLGSPRDRPRLIHTAIYSFTKWYVSRKKFFCSSLGSFDFLTSFLSSSNSCGVMSMKSELQNNNMLYGTGTKFGCPFFKRKSTFAVLDQELLPPTETSQSQQDCRFQIGHTLFPHLSCWVAHSSLCLLKFPFAAAGNTLIKVWLLLAWLGRR